ncbi:radical SAM family protein [Desulforapulum autotrophicum]|nr:radical SAM protein [Desulforapulum autotrophicum]
MTKSRDPATMNDIEIIPGNINILLIAPHGHDEDDKNTGKLVRHVAEQSGCYAIINEFYGRKAEASRRINLNNLPEIEKHLQDGFLKPLIAYKNEIIKANGNALIFWIHGAKNKSVEGDIQKGTDVNPDVVKVLVGYGQKTENNRYTAEPITANTLIEALTKNGLDAVAANPDKKVDVKKGIYSYCGHDITNMNQLFKNKEYLDPNVESVQLEFRMEGCRDNEKNIKSTAESIARAISSFVQPEIVVAPVKQVYPGDEQKKESALAKRMSDEDSRKNAIEVQDPIVSKAYDKLAQVFSKNYEQALMEAGQYIVRTFYGGEENIEDQQYNEKLEFSKEVIARARDKKSTKEETLNQLYEKIDKNRDANSPSRSKLYRAVNLIVQNQDLKKYLSSSTFSTLKKLSLSHKIYLLGIKELDRKQAFIKKIADEQLTIKQLQKAKQKSQSKDPTPVFLINHPEKLTDDKIQQVLSFDALKSQPPKKLQEIKEKVESRNKDVGEEIKRLAGLIEDHKGYLTKFDDIKVDVEKAIEFKKNAPQQPKKRASKIKVKQKSKDPKATGFQEWTKKENNVNVCTGCSNDCKYCYAKSMAYRFKQVEEGQWANEQIRQPEVDKKRKLYDGRVGFPTSHDITASNVDAYLKVLKNLLSLGNEILIVSKPNFDCIKRICEIGADYKDKILFRFTIGAMDDDILRFWDTNAPLYEERRKCLIYAHEKGFGTSVSMEPLLDASRVVEMATDSAPYVSDYIWIGKMNHLPRLKSKAEADNDQEMIRQIEKIELGQTKDKVLAIYDEFKAKPELLKKIKWKDSYKKVLGIDKAAEPGMDI